jgi:hypothetical protein
MYGASTMNEPEGVLYYSEYQDGGVSSLGMVIKFFFANFANFIFSLPDNGIVAMQTSES